MSIYFLHIFLIFRTFVPVNATWDYCDIAEVSPANYL